MIVLPPLARSSKTRNFFFVRDVVARRSLVVAPPHADRKAEPARPLEESVVPPRGDERGLVLLRNRRVAAGGGP